MCADWIPLMQARDKKKPFFLWLAALDPHRPYHEGIIENGAKPEDIQLAPYHADTPETRKDYTVYYDEITRLDKYVGQVMAELKKQGVADNTLVLFFSDNGRPFPRDKTTVYDSGIKTPWIVHWPGKVKAGSTTSQLVSSVDIARTAMDAAGITEIGDSFEGHSFLPLLTQPDKPIREYIFAEKNWHDFEDHVRAVRNERYKYIRNYYDDLPQTPSADSARSVTFEAILALEKEGKLLPHQRTCLIAPRPKEELYDTQVDPHELNNLIADEQHKPLLETMRSQLKDWEKLTKDYVPDLRTADEFDRVTGVPTDARVRPRLSKKEMVEKGLVAP